MALRSVAAGGVCEVSLPPRMMRGLADAALRIKDMRDRICRGQEGHRIDPLGDERAQVRVGVDPGRGFPKR